MQNKHIKQVDWHLHLQKLGIDMYATTSSRSQQLHDADILDTDTLRCHISAKAENGAGLLDTPTVNMHNMQGVKHVIT